jgi:hypothetical protein
MDYAAALQKLLTLGFVLTTPEGETVSVVSGMLFVEKDGDINTYSDPHFYTEALVMRLS